MDIDFYRFPFALKPHYHALSMSHNDLVESYRFGSITERQYDWCMLFCSWSAVRLEGSAGKWQDRCYNAFGCEGVDKRIARIQKLKERYMLHHFGAYTFEALAKQSEKRLSK